MRLLLLFLPLHCVYSYKILVYNPKFGHSMSTFMGSIADTLAVAGHEVTSLISTIDPKLNDGTTKSKIIEVKQSQATKQLYDDFTTAKSDLFGTNIYDPMKSYYVGKFFGSLFATQCRAILDSPGLIEQLQKEKFDVMIVENFDMCGVALTEVIKPKTFIGSASNVAFGPQLDEFGIPSFVSFDPTLYTTSMNVHSTWDRLLNVYLDYIVRWLYYYMRTDIDNLFQEKFGSSFPSVKSIATYSAYNFVNSEPLVDFATPTISKIIYVGGIGTKSAKSLSSEWEKVFDLRDKTILLSFGSFCKSIYLSTEIKRAILETIQSLPEITFIWKYEEDDEFTRNEASKVKNLVLTKWMPQTDILNHPSLTAFITHGGMASTLEIARAGVPAIIIPLFADQPRNAAMMEHNGLGKIFDKFDLNNSSRLIETIKEVVGDERYRKRAKHVSSMIRNKPHTAQELVIKYVEFAAEFGAASALRPQSHGMNWIEYNNVDIILCGLLICTISIIILFKVAQSLIRVIRTRKDKVE